MNIHSNTTLDSLGYNPSFQKSRLDLGFESSAVARVTSEHRGAYKIINENGEYLARVRGKQMFQASSREDYPAVGDWVVITPQGDEQATIEGILPRQSILKRKHGDKTRVGQKGEIQVIAANIDTAFVVQAMDRDYSLNRFERYFALAENGGVKPAIILNKIDLISGDELEGKIVEIRKRFPGIDIITTSTVSDEGLEELKRYTVSGKTYCFLGSSGVGKSTLINRLLNKEATSTGDIGSYSGRGKHVTTTRQMYFLDNGGIVIDNPGVREVGLSDDVEGIDSFFEKIADMAHSCRFADCTHTREPGCEIVRAIQAGELDANQYSNYLNLKKEAEYQEMNEIEKKQKDRQFGKMVKKVKKGLGEL